MAGKSKLCRNSFLCGNCAKANVKKRKHLGEQKLWRARVLRKQKEWQDFQSKVNKLRQVERQS